jgi:hypothetical protein
MQDCLHLIFYLSGKDACVLQHRAAYPPVQADLRLLYPKQARSLHAGLALTGFCGNTDFFKNMVLICFLYARG